MDIFMRRRGRGRPPHPDVLTPAEWRVLALLRRGKTNGGIAAELGLGIETVKTHVSNMLAKLEVRDRAALAAWDGEPAAVSREALARPSMFLFAPLGGFGRALAILATPAKVIILVGICAGTVAGAAFAVHAAQTHEGGDVVASGQIDVGAADQFAAGSVTTVAYADGRELARSVNGTPPLPLLSEQPSSTDATVVHIVHLTDGSFRALSARDPHPKGCFVPWRPQFVFNETTGWFREPCLGSTYDMTGHLVFGPSPRDLDRYPVQIRNNHVFVTLSPDALVRGDAVPSVNAACDSSALPPPAANEPSEAWARARARLSGDTPVFRPMTMPPRFDQGTLLEACVDPQAGARYTVWYRNGDESILFILGQGFGAWGNFPGPPTATKQVAVRGATGTLVETAGAVANGQRLATSRSLSWEQGGHRYEIRAYSDDVSDDDLVQLTQSLVLEP